MRLIELDGRSWVTVEDLYDALLPALGAPDWHGRNIHALTDSMGTGSINEIEPPYMIKISGAAHWSEDLRDFVRALRTYVAEGARYSLEQYGERRDIEIVLEGDF